MHLLFNSSSISRRINDLPSEPKRLNFYSSVKITAKICYLGRSIRVFTSSWKMEFPYLYVRHCAHLRLLNPFKRYIDCAVFPRNTNIPAKCEFLQQKIFLLNRDMYSTVNVYRLKHIFCFIFVQYLQETAAHAWDMLKEITL